jgi:hypothetical protein
MTISSINIDVRCVVNVLCADPKPTHRLHQQSFDDQSHGDTTKVKLKVAFLSVVLLHDDQLTSMSNEDNDLSLNSLSSKTRLHGLAEKYFDSVRRDVTIAGVTTAQGMAQLRNSYSKACPVDHIGYTAVECYQHILNPK